MFGAHSLTRVVVIGGVLTLCLGSAAYAADGGNLILGHTNRADSTTTLFQGSQSATLQEPGTAFWAYGNTLGVLGQAGQDGSVPAGENVGVAGLGSDWGGYFFGIDRGIVAESVEDGPAVSASGDTAVVADGSTTGLRTSGATAIDATGMLRFNAAGIATVPAGSQSVTITPRVDLTLGQPKVFVTVQTSGGTFKRVGISGTKLTLYLTKIASVRVKLAYFIIS
jgi:hypothetical protein